LTDPTGKQFVIGAVELYAHPGVSVLCLELQDAFKLDVNCVLACLWASRAGHGVLSDQVLRDLVDISAQWNTSVIAPLRAARRALRTWIAEPVDEALGALKKDIGATELAAEMVELKWLGQTLARVQGTHAWDHETTLANLANYAKMADVELDANLQRRLAELAQLAAF
jgi:uncharacterized protein (TIGR02444 family)